MHKHFYIIGNWKSNKNISQAVEWMQDFTYLCQKQPINTEKVSVILCPSFIHLTTLKSLIEIKRLPIKLGIQDISPFPMGAYTGEVAAEMVKDLVDYVLVGHSERRKLFAEKRGELVKEMEQAHASKIKTIYCVQNDEMVLPENCDLVGYEPVWAIGSGKPESAANANDAAKNLLKKQRKGRNIKIIYGGSVKAENVVEYYHQEFINGVLPGGASLDPKTFQQMILNIQNA